MKIIYLRKILINAYIALYASCGFASEQWISEIDQSYKNVDYNLYLKVMKAKSLIPGNLTELQEAAVLLDEVIKTYPDFAPAYVQVARLLSSSQSTKETKDAMESVLDTALKLEPEYGYAMAMMAYTKIRKKELDEAELYLQKADQSGTSYPYLKSMWSDLLLRKGQYKEAAEIAIEGFNDYEDDPVLAANYIKMILGSYRRIQGSLDDQDYWYKKRIELRPDIASFHSSYSFFLIYHKHDFDAALIHAEKSVEIESNEVTRRALATALYCKWAVLDDTPNKEYESKQHYNRAMSVDTDFDYLLSQISKNIYKHNSQTITPIYIKLLNSKIKMGNAKQDLKSGRLQQHEYDALTSSP